MDDDRILRLGGDENDISEYAKHNGADLTQSKSKDVNEFEEVVKIEADLIFKFNEFIQKWTGNSFAHLIDSDENDGQEFRNAISEAISEAEKRGEERERKKITEYQNGFIRDDGQGNPERAPEWQVVEDLLDFLNHQKG